MNIKKLRILSFSEIGLSSSLFIIGLVDLLVFLIMPFPERWSPSEMEPDMIAKNEHITFYCLLIFSIFVVIFYVCSLVLRQIISIFIYRLDVNKRIENLTKKQKVLKLTLYLTIIFFVLWIPFFISSYFLIKSKIKDNKNNQVAINKKIYKTWKTMVCLFPVLTAGIVVPTILFYPLNVIINKQSIESNLTYSINKENTIVLYFDRAMGSVWNMVLYQDYLENKESSFIYKYPEFNSYLNTITTGNPTNFSNMFMQGSLWFGPNLLGSNLINPVTSKPYNSYNQDQYLQTALKNNFDNYKNNYEYSQFDILDLPYYGKVFTNVSGEYWTLDEDIKSWNLNGGSTSSTAVLKNYGLPFDGSNRDSGYYLKMISDKNNNHLNFKNTNGNVFKYLYFQNTHGGYVVENKNKELDVKGEHFSDFVLSMKYSINSLNKFFDTLKNTPWGDETNNESVYDHSNIIILSDHGNYVSVKYQNEFNDFWNYSGFWNSKQKVDANKVWWFFNDFAAVNSLFMYKPSKTINTTTLKNYSTTNFFNTTDLICNYDFPIIIDSLMYRSKNNSVPTSSYLKPDISSYEDNKYKEIDKLLSFDPLNDNLNVNQRENILCYGAKDWRWNNEAKEFATNSRKRLVNFKGHSSIISNGVWKWIES